MDVKAAQRYLVAQCCTGLMDNGYKVVISSESALAFGYYVSPIYDYSQCNLVVTDEIANHSKLEETLNSLEGISVTESHCVDCLAWHVTVANNETSVTFIIFYDFVSGIGLKGGLIDEGICEMQGAYPVPNLDYLLKLYVQNAEKGAILTERPMGYSKVLAPSSWVYHALVIWGLFRDKLSRESIESLYDLCNIVTLDTIALPNLDDAEYSKAKDWLESVFSATWEEEYRG